MIQSNASGVKRLVIDPITALIYHYPKRIERRYALWELFRALMELKITSLIVSENRSSAHEREYQVEEFLSHGVILLHTFNEAGRVVRGIQIEKMRGISHDYQLRPYHLTKHGIMIYPTEKIIS
jgi:KaiC/GvpD/RAD55 family RecA-like ATPase